MIAVKIGTVSWRQIGQLAADEVEFIGDWIMAPDGFTPYMVWDAGLNNARPMTQPEIDALPGQIATAAARQEKSAATQGVDDAFQQHGNRVERIVMAVATTALDAFNNDRACMTAMNSAVQGAASLAALKTAFAAISFPPQVTLQQLASVIKSKIAATPE